MARNGINYSANFKRDYIACMATGLFFFIIAAEAVLAVSIPVYTRREGVMAVEVMRQRMFNDFDSLRNSVRSGRLKAEDSISGCELRLLEWHLNRIADYLRRYGRELNAGEIGEISEMIRFSRVAAESARAGRVSCTEEQLDSADFLKRMIAAERKDVR